MKTLPLQKLPLVFAILTLAAGVSTLRAQTTYYVEDDQFSYQYSTAAPSVDSTNAYQFQPGESSYTYTSVTGPNGTYTISNVAGGSGNYNYKSASTYDTLGELEVNYPDGNYTFNSSGPTVDLMGDDFPSAPDLTEVNGATPDWSGGDLVLDATKSETLTWSIATSTTNAQGYNYATGGHISLSLTGGSVSDHASALGPASQAALTSYVVPASQLTVGDYYNLNLGYFLADQATEVSGTILNAAGYEADNYITVEAIPEPPVWALMLLGCGSLFLGRRFLGLRKQTAPS